MDDNQTGPMSTDPISAAHRHRCRNGNDFAGKAPRVLGFLDRLLASEREAILCLTRIS